MKIHAFLFASLVSISFVDALPAAEDSSLVSKVRSKRQEGEILPKLPSLPEDALAPPKAPLEANKELDVIADGSAADAVDRVKKQACLQAPCGSKAMCAGMPCGEPMARAAQEPVLMELRPHMMQGRTIEPVVSFGPVQGSYGGAASYGSNMYSMQPKPLPSYAPSGMQFSAVIPMMHHRHPLLHHGVELSHSAAYDSRPEMYFYNAPEPIYVAAPLNTVADEAHRESSLNLYCENLNKKKEGKALPEERANLTEEAAINDHIARVNEIKEEITQLNNAAHRIVDQQERLARLHQDHMSMIAAKSADPYPAHLRSFEPLMRHHESQMKMPYGMYGGGYIRPHPFRSAEEMSTPAPTMKPMSADSAAAAPRESDQGSMPQMRGTDDYMRPNYYPSYPYYYRSEPGMYGSAYPTSYPDYRSATGLQVPTIFGRTNEQSNPQEEAKELFMKMVEMGQKMGVVPKDFQPGKMAPAEKAKAEEPTRSEGIVDVMYSVDQKSNSPSKIDLGDSAPAPKKDKRGLVQKNMQ